MVPQERLELSRLSALASKTSVSTIPPSGQIHTTYNLVSMARIELALHAPKARVIPFHYIEIKTFGGDGWI